MLDLVEKHILLPQQFIFIALQSTLRRNILNAEQDILVGLLINNDAGIQQQYAFSDAGKVVLDLIIIHIAMTRYNVFQQRSKFWNVPLAVAQLVKMFTLGIVGIGCELHIEGAAFCGSLRGA